MSSAYPANAVANHFLRRASEANEPLTAMRLQKLIYFAHGWHLALLGRPLIEERIHAWDIGPLVNHVFIEFKRFGAAPILEGASHLVRIPGGNYTFEPYRLPSEASVAGLLDQVQVLYGGIPEAKLLAMVTAPGTPWAKAYRNGGAPLPRPISHRDFADAFHQKRRQKSL